MTLEEAQAEIIRLQEENGKLTAENETLSQDNKNLNTQLNTVRQINQEYYLKLRAQNSHDQDKNDDEEEEVQSCEDFAKTLDII